MAFRQWPNEKPAEMTGRWITQRVNDAQGGKDRERRINPLKGEHVSCTLTDATQMTDLHTNTNTHTGTGVCTAHPVCLLFLRCRAVTCTHAVHDKRNVSENIFLEEALLFAFLTRTHFGVCCMTQSHAFIYDVCEKMSGAVIVMRE